MSRRRRGLWVGLALLAASLVMLVVYAVGVQAEGQWFYTWWFADQWME